MAPPGSAPPFAAVSSAAATVLSKVHSTAVAVVPPAAVWRRIQAIRYSRDKSFVRWPPHINLLYPFLPDGGEGSDTGFQHMALRAGRALSGVTPFRVRLERLRTFRHSARSLTLWADPLILAPPAVDHSGPGAGGGVGAAGSSCGTGGGGLHEVQRLLEAEFRGCDDLSRDEARGIDGFVPHLSLGQLRDEGELEALQAAWQPLEFLVDSVQLISRQGYLPPFTIRYHVPFGLDLAPPLDRCASGPQGRRSGPGQQTVAAAQWPPGADPAGAGDSSDGGGGHGGVCRINVPYVATMACLAGSSGGSQGQAGLGGTVGRWASPCLALPLRPSVRTTAGNDDGSGCAGPPAVACRSVPAGDEAGGVTGGQPLGGANGGDVWWFAYGAALTATGPQIGAVQSMAARAEGYRLAFNRRRGRANLLPEAPEEAPVAAVAGCSAAPAWAPSRDSLPQPSQGASAGPAAAEAGGALPGVHGVLHRLPVSRLALLLLANSEAWPIEVRCCPYGQIRNTNADGAPPTSTTTTTGPATTTTTTTGAATWPPAPAAALEPLVAVAFRVPPDRCLAREVAPTEGYIAAMRQAGELYGIDPTFQRWLGDLATAGDGAERSPAYGTGLDGRALGREGPFRTGAKKAAGGLPGAIKDW